MGTTILSQCKSFIGFHLVIWRQVKDNVGHALRLREGAACLRALLALLRKTKTAGVGHVHLLRAGVACLTISLRWCQLMERLTKIAIQCGSHQMQQKAVIGKQTTSATVGGGASVHGLQLLIAADRVLNC
ncbi:hypothetical protein FRX31_010962 [Thalictrum thalictroides]|uniref:Uncharacterized protein n=1 Tax=Thalictrum thalictroides TaxID=46969 RepID=A0A7J6WQ15_THATH|nr:hypothetical protein FRX31_010962 [Thalictrum thalictroides]